ncbi:hypothetical protein [Campylobacter rectus]|uniref:hypothetical protein n=1 Tax=Campylobacter rectus TaxID=203 RepID=UPI0028DB9142|nr:hypothetical protein [Campylobacter rectus]
MGFDSSLKAVNLRINLFKVGGRAFMPYACRKSVKFNDENARDRIRKGCVVPYQ